MVSIVAINNERQTNIWNSKEVEIMAAHKSQGWKNIL